ncbi:unnamed protein product, partial [Oikopleura dioica]
MIRKAVRGSCARISCRPQSVTVNKGWFRPKVQIERVDLERYFIIVEDPSHVVWQKLTEISVIEDRYQIFDQNGVDRNIFGDVVSRFPEILEYSLENIDNHLKFWSEMFQNSSDCSFHLKSYPEACFHLDNAAYLTRRNEMLKFLFSNFGINQKMSIRLILAYPKFFNNEVSQIATKVEMLKNLYLSMGGKNFKVFGRSQLAQNVLILEKPETMSDFIDLMTKTGLSSEETLKIISKMAGVLPDLALENVEKTMQLLREELKLENSSEMKKICLEVAGFTWNKRYITFYADFFVLMELDDLENWEKENGPNKDMLADYIFLPDVNFSWKRMSEMEIMVTNRSRECTIRVKQKEHCSVILQHLCALKYLAMNNLNGCSSPIKQPISESEAKSPKLFKKNRTPFSSSFPVRPHTPAKWYICGDAYMSNLADSIEAASERVFLADWQISPMIYLKRNYEGTYWRLDQVLKRAANRGVRIYILVYQDPTALGLKNYEATKYLREKCLWKKHANLFTLTHPTLDGPNKWSHHEKLAVIDDKIAFIGGLDLSMGRWDVHGKYFMFDPERRTFKGFDYWSQFNSKPNQNLIDCNYEKGENFFRTNCRFDENKDYLDRMTEMRTPWHDIAARLQGEAAFDVSLHFIERWNMTSHTAYQSAVKINLPVFRKIPRQIDEVNTSCQIIRSAAAWSAGLRSTERTIYDNYKALIESAERFIFIENQFFVTTTGDYKLDDSLPQNQIALFLCDRIIKAFKKGEQFRVYIVIPCIPGSGGSLEENTAAGQEILLHITYESICRHENSIYEYLKRCEPTIEVEDFIYFASYRTHEEFNGGIHQAVVYPHSKLMIVDDRFTIIGSANINDRSLLGDRDS